MKVGDLARAFASEPRRHRTSIAIELRAFMHDRMRGSRLRERRPRLVEGRDVRERARDPAITLGRRARVAVDDRFPAEAGIEDVSSLVGEIWSHGDAAGRRLGVGLVSDWCRTGVGLVSDWCQTPV